MNLQIFLALSIALTSIPASAEVFKWVDENGKVHYGDQIPEKYRSHDNSVGTEKLNVVETKKHKFKPSKSASTQNQKNSRRNPETRPPLDRKRFEKDRKYREKYIADLEAQSDKSAPDWYEQRKAQYKEEQPCDTRGVADKYKKEFKRTCKRWYFQPQLNQ